MEEYKHGEELAMKCLEATGHSIIDRRDTKEYWYLDIDMTAINQLGMRFEIEVKWDKQISKTQSMFLETTADINNNKAGWATYTKADYIFYGDAINKLFYVFKADDMREYLDRYNNEYEERIANDWGRNGKLRK